MLLVFAALTALMLPGALFGEVVFVTPSEDWCAAVNKATAGDEIVLAQGSYTTPCWIRAQGDPGAPVIVRSESEELTKRSVLAYPGSTSNVVELHAATHLVLRGISFGPTQDNVDAIRIRGGSDISVERCHFTSIGGIAITANDRTTYRLNILENTFENLRQTGVYLGCHNGKTCFSRDFRFERNLIRGVTSPHVGYGMQAKLNSYGIIRDNAIYATKGPGIMVYGSDRGDPASILEGNYVEGSLNEGGIVLGGGPAIVRNNVLVGNAYGGISAQNYGGRDLQRSVWIVHNTIIANADSGINVAGWRRGRDNVIGYNAILPLAGTLAIRPPRPAGNVTNNVSCDASCFLESGGPPYDLRPRADGPLVDSLGPSAEPWRATDDFMGVERGERVTVGAFESSLRTDAVEVGGWKPRPSRASAPQ